jgi:hypothetical protein
MLPNVRLVLATIAAALLVASLGIGLLSASRTASVFPIGLRSAKGSPVERALPEPPDWKQFVVLSAARRAEELNRLIELPGPAPGSLPDAPAPGAIERGELPEPAAQPTANAAPAVRQ